MGDPSGFVRLMRPVNSLMVGFAVIVGAVIGGGAGLLGSPVDLVLAFFTGFTLTGSAMAINDYYDRETDAINEPARPIPSGAVKPKEALILFILLTALGLASSWETGLGSLVIAASAWFVAVVYSTVGKRTGLPGNLMVSSCIALPFLYGGVTVGGSALKASLLFAVIAFLANTGREVTKGIVDLEGDRSSGVATVAVSRGPPAAAWLSALCYVSSVVFSLAPPYLGLVSLWYVPFVVVTDVGLLYLSLSLVRDPSRENSRRVKNLVRMLMVSGLFGFLAGSLF
jgi:geranylgeranylglycerol-phosphate geranylgeranyltransferase